MGERNVMVCVCVRVCGDSLGDRVRVIGLTLDTEARTCIFSAVAR